MKTWTILLHDVPSLPLMTTILVIRESRSAHGIAVVSPLVSRDGTTTSSLRGELQNIMS